MKLRDLKPELETASQGDFLRGVDFGNVFLLLPQIGQYYDTQITYARLLPYYGIHDVEVGSDVVQVNCILLEHGTADKNRSARYYAYDKNTGLPDEAIYCFKCQKALKPFWYLYKMEKDYHNRSLIEFFDFLLVTFGVSFPRDLLLDFDPETYFTFTESKNKLNILKLFDKAKEVRGIRSVDTLGYLNSLVALYNYKQD